MKINKALLLLFAIIALLQNVKGDEDHVQQGDKINECSKDVLRCPDGHYVARNPNNNCEYPPCAEGATADCDNDTFLCPDGRQVGRDAGNECNFLPCPELDTKCDWCIAETKPVEVEPTSVEVPDCPLEICGVCYYEGLPLSNAKDKKCGRGTSRFGGYCACWSGAFGKNCSMGLNALSNKLHPYPWRDIKNENYKNIDLLDMTDTHFESEWTGHPTCASFLSTEALLTKAPPVIESTTFINSNLDIRVSLPMVSGRAESIAYLNSGHDIGHCIYPKSDYISKEIEGCKDIYHFSIPWNISETCGWRKLDEETHFTYCGQIIVQHTEWMENICDWRFTQSVLNIKLRFQKYARLDTAIVGVNRPDIKAAITNQIVLVNCPEPALVELTTLTNWAYKLDTNFNLTLSPPGKIDKYDKEYDDCTAEEEKSCRQRFRTLLDLSSSACTLDGRYQLTFPSVKCVPGFSDCALRAEDMNPVKIDYSLISENFCAVVRADILLSASINLYEDSAFTVPRKLFMVGQKAYFKVKVESGMKDSMSKSPITFTSIKILTVSLRGVVDKMPVFIVEQGKPTTVTGVTQKESVSYNLIQISTDEIGFSFDMVHSLISKLLKSKNVNTFTVGIEVEVAFSNGDLKRGVYEYLAEGKDSATFSVETGVTNFGDNKGSANAIVFSILLLSLLTLLF